MVIGGGCAGCWAALKASEHDLDVTLLNKYTLGKSGTTIVAMITYQAIMGDLGIHPEDTEEIFFNDVVKGGASIGEQNLIEILVRNGKQTILDLEALGVKWDKIDGKYDLKQLSGMTYPRGCFVDHRTGLSIQRALVRAVKKRKNIRYLERMVTRLLTSQGNVVGALAFDIHRGTFIKVSAKSVVMATGGSGRLYKVSSMPEDARGDGMALAYKAGATLMDMEFQQFFPATLAYPESMRGLVVPRETTVPLGARILNGRGERFMHLYYPEAELATRDKASIAIMREVMKGNGTPHGGVYMDVSRVQNIIEKYPTSFKDFKEAGFNIPEEWIEICPGHHFTVGGIKINEFCETTLPGLYAAGEVAANVHGANRIGGAALAECSVFGQIAGRHAAIHARFMKAIEIPHQGVEEDINRVIGLLEKGQAGETRPISLLRRLQEVMHEQVGVIRSGEGLKKAIEEILHLKGKMNDLKINPSLIYNNELVDAIDLDNMLLLAEVIAKAALERTESRGNHHRIDYPEQNDPGWRKHSIIRNRSGKINLSTQSVTVTRSRSSYSTDGRR